MPDKPLLECGFLIPTHRDKELADGEVHPLEAWNWLHDALYDRFDGRTIAPGLYDGLWKSSKTGNPIADQSRKYLVALPESRAAELRQLLSEACLVFHQQMIYLTIAGRVEMIEGPSDGPGS